MMQENDQILKKIRKYKLPILFIFTLANLKMKPMNLEPNKEYSVAPSMYSALNQDTLLSIVVIIFAIIGLLFCLLQT